MYVEISITDSCADDHDCVLLLDQIPFGTFTKQLCKVTGSLVMSGHPSVNMEQFGCYKLNFLKIL
jgi:hypothetical protein